MADNNELEVELKIGLSDEDKQQMADEIYDKVNDETQKELDEMHETIQSFGQLRPAGTDISTNILNFKQDKGVYVATDNGYWYYWNGSAYVYGGVYQATEIADKSVTISKLSNELFDGTKNNKVYYDNEDFLNDFRTVANESTDVVINDYVRFISSSGSHSIYKPFNNYNIGDTLNFDITFRINSYENSTLTAWRIGFIRYNDKEEILNIYLDTNHNMWLNRSNLINATADVISGTMTLGEVFTIRVTIKTATSTINPFLSFSFSNKDMTSISADILDFKCQEINNEKVQVKYAEEAERLKDFNPKTSKILPAKDMEEWKKLKLGLFIHWGVYAVLEGKYNGLNSYGQQVEFDIATNGGGAGSEYTFKLAKIPMETYKSYQTQFNSANWNAEEIARLAYEAGMTYIIITAKHHEGFVLFDSDNAEWNVNTSNARTTILDELKNACDKYGLKFGLYFSQNLDWTANGGFGQDFYNGTDPYSAEEHNAFIQKEKLLIQEMIERFNPDILWWDIPANNSYMQDLKNWQVENYPNIITNDRLLGSGSGDFDTGEGAYYQGNRDCAENCYNLNGSWGYSSTKDTASQTKGVKEVLKKLILESIARNQNCLINIGPKKDGSIPELQKQVLIDIANFVKKYGLMYNSNNTHKTCHPTWGRMIRKDNKVLCYIYPGSGNEIVIDGINTLFISNVRVFGANEENALSNYEVLSSDKLKIKNIVYDSNYKIGIVEIEFLRKPISNDINYISVNTEFTSLTFNLYGGVSLYNIDTLPDIGAWTSNNAYVETIINWNSESGSYYFNYNISSKQGTNFTLTITLTDTLTNEEQSITIDGTSSTSLSTFNLINGKNYKIKIVKNGNWINLRSCKFTN